MKSYVLIAAAIALTLSTFSAGAQDRGYRNPQPQRGYGNNNNNDGNRGYDNDRWIDDDDRRYRGYDQGQWQARNGHYWNGARHMSPAEYQRWRRYQRHRARQNWAYQQGVRDGRQQANRGGSGNGRW